MVIETHPMRQGRPRLKLVYDLGARKKLPPQLLNLAQEADESIVRARDPKALGIVVADYL